MINSLSVSAQTPAPLVDPPGGLYCSPVSVHLHTTIDDSVIRYTLNGDIPNENSCVYAGPLLCKELTGTPNGISEIPSAPPESWHPPVGEVFKCSILRARAFKKGTKPSRTVSHSYFVDPNMTSRYSLPILSLITEERDFFDYEKGIYVPGQGWETKYWFKDAMGNYAHRGKDWERKIHLEFFEPGEAIAGWTQDMGVRIHGGLTRNFRSKSLRFYARREYGNPEVDYPFFGEDRTKKMKRFILRNGGGDCFGTIVRDAFHQRLIENAGVDTQDCRTTVVFLNGEYWGIHNLRERQDKHFLKRKYGVDTNNLDIVSEVPEDIVPECIETDEGDLQEFGKLIDFMKTSDLSDPAIYRIAASRINIPSHITYYATRIFIGDKDWPGNNVKLWRPRDGSRKWEWLLFDTDGGSGAEPPARNKLKHVSQNWYPTAPVFIGLLKNNDYRRDFITRFSDLLNTRLSVSHSFAKLNEIRDQLIAGIEEHGNRWGDPGRKSSWEAGIKEIADWIEQRHNHIWDHLRDFFHLTSTSELTVATSVPNSGAVKVNTLFPSDIPLPWSGEYFNDLPVTLEALPATGHVFSHWQETNETKSALKFILTGNTTRTAVFVKGKQACLKL